MKPESLLRLSRCLLRFFSAITLSLLNTTLQSVNLLTLSNGQKPD
jgi:hypothetical protein